VAGSQANRRGNHLQGRAGRVRRPCCADRAGLGPASPRKL